MEITKINGEEIKIGKTSITVKGDRSYKELHHYKQLIGT